MEIQLCASGFSTAWDGTYTQKGDDDSAYILKGSDIWAHSSINYWIYRDSQYWYISDSPYLYYEPYGKARKIFTEDDPSPVGNYEGIFGNPNGSVSLGA